MVYTIKLLRFSLAISLLCLGAPCIAGGGFPTVPDILDKEWASHQIISSTRLKAGGLGFNAGDPTERHKAMRVFLRGRGVHPLLNFVEKPSDFSVPTSGLGLTVTNQLRVREYSLRAGQYEVCKSSIRTVETPNGGLHVLGVSPRVDAVYPFADDAWTSLEDAVNLAMANLEKTGVDTRSAKLTSFSKCVFPVQNELEPAWRLIIRSGVSPYLIYVGDSEVLDGDIMSFDATAMVRAYSTNPTSGALKNFEINVTGDGYMSNEYFATEDGGSTGRLFSPGNSFLSAPDTSYFAEQSSFAHVNEHFDFSSSLGYVWKGPKPLTVKTHVVFSEGPNNALYSPFDGSSGPFIMIGDGDGTVFKGLPFDSDVVSHEFGHHIIFSSVTETRGESLIIHEGLADAIVFMKTGDACLGESICPAAGTSCQVKGQCLRSGSNSLKYKDAAYNAAKGAHIQGQLVSGLIWDLRNGGQIPNADMSRLVIGMVNFLPKQADMQSLVTGLLDADYALFNKQYQSVIVNAASARGLGLDTLNIDLSSIDGVAPSSGSSAKSDSGGKGFLGLCSIGAGITSGSSAAWIAVILMLPILLQALSSRPRPHPIKEKKK